MKQIYKHEVTIHKGELPDQTFDFDTVSIDLEMFNQEDNKLHRPHGDFASLACCYNGRDVYIIFDEKQVGEFLARLNKSLWIFHNASYDIRQLRRFADIPDRKLIWDTMLVEQIRFSGYYDRFALDDLYRRYCYKYLPKQERKSFSGHTGEMTEEQIWYAACDVVATWEVYQEQSKQITEDELYLWENIERPFLFTLLDTGGVLINVDEWTKIAKDKRDKSSAIWEQLEKEYGINIRSDDQLLAFLRENVDEDIENVQAKTLEHYRNKHPIINPILEYRPLQKRASTYGDNWLDGTIEPDGRVYTSWNQIGAKTSRMSSSSPNLQNIPVKTEKIYRYCFMAGEGNLFVIGDWSSQEPRNLAYLSQDEKLISIFKSGEDVYIGVGYEVFGERFGKKDKRRKDMKALVLGLSYGMSKYGLKDKLDEYDPETIHTLEYAEELIDRFFEVFPNVHRYIEENRKKARKLGYVETIWGRKIYISPYDPRLDTEAPNYSIQGSAGESIKVAANRLRKQWKGEFNTNPIRLYVHDELAAEVPKAHAPYAKELLEKLMIDTAEQMHEGIPGAADVSIGKSWGDKE